MALSIVSSASAVAATATMPTHAVGDLILVWTFRGGSTTYASVPASSGWVMMIQKGGTTCCGQLWGKIATATNHTTGTWTNASSIAIVVLRGHAGIGGTIGDGASGNNTDFAACPLVNTDGSSWTFGFMGHRTATNLHSTAPANPPAVAVVGNNAANGSAVKTSNAGVTSDALGNLVANASSGWASVTIEIMVANTTTLSDTFSTGTVPDSTKWVTQATLSGMTHAVGSGVYTATASNGVGTMITKKAYDLTGRYVSAQLTSSTAAVAASLGFVSVPSDFLDLFASTWSGYMLGGFTVEANITTGTRCFWWIGSTPTQVGSSRSYTAGEYQRIREASGTIYFDYSANGTTWTNAASIALPVAGLTNGRAAALTNSTSSGVATYDNYSIDVTPVVASGNFLAYM